MTTTAARVVCAFGLSLAAPAVAGQVEVPPDAMIRLERTSCFGACPIYTVTIDARGTVTYEGEKFVRVTGRQSRQIEESLVATLLATAERIGFFELRDAYRFIENPDGSRTVVGDLPTKFVTVTVNGRTKRVEDYVAAPEGLADFERDIDEAAGTTRWIFIDQEALEELVRSGWSAAGEEGATLLRRAIGRDDLAIATRLIELGADLNGPRPNRLPPLLRVRSGSMVELLVAAGADPNERAVGRVTTRTPLMRTAYLGADVAEALFRAGARLEDLEDGRTALWYAACAGNWRVVEVLLRAGANPRGGTSDLSAMACTREARQNEMNMRRTILDRGRPTVEDFDRVIALLEQADSPLNR